MRKQIVFNHNATNSIVKFKEDKQGWNKITIKNGHSTNMRISEDVGNLMINTLRLSTDYVEQSQAVQNLSDTLGNKLLV